MRQKNKEIFTDSETGERWISADVIDYEYVWRFLNKALSESLSEISDRGRDCLKAACLLEYDKPKKRNIKNDWTFTELQEKAKELGIDMHSKRAARATLYGFVWLISSCRK